MNCHREARPSLKLIFYDKAGTVPSAQNHCTQLTIPVPDPVLTARMVEKISFIFMHTTPNLVCIMLTDN